MNAIIILSFSKKRRRIDAVDGAAKGGNVMTAFDNSEWEKTGAEAKARWGLTDAYKQYEEKTGAYYGQEWNDAAEGMDRIMAAFALCRKNGDAAVSAEAQAPVRRLQSFITEHYYHCTDPLLAGLGRMYVSGERFRQNIDKHGTGTAGNICEAIAACCGKQATMP